jgi:hypothetical protein
MRTRLFSHSSGRRGRTALLLALASGVVVALGLSAGPTAAARLGVAPTAPRPTISVCADTPAVYIYWAAFHRPPTYSTVSPQPNACWISTEYDLNSAYEHSNWTICDGYPSVQQHPHGDGSLTAYDDTNASHVSPDESTAIANGCLNGGSHLDLEFEAAGAGYCTGDSSHNWVARNTGFTVGVYLRELYRYANSCRDEITCPTPSDSTHGCVINAGADVPVSFGGPCGGAVSGCKAQLATDISNVCNNDNSGPKVLGIFGGYALNSDDNGTDDAAKWAGWLNADINNDCAYLFTG